MHPTGIKMNAKVGIHASGTFHSPVRAWPYPYQSQKLYVRGATRPMQERGVTSFEYSKGGHSEFMEYDLQMTARRAQMCDANPFRFNEDYARYGSGRLFSQTASTSDDHDDDNDDDDETEDGSRDGKDSGDNDDEFSQDGRRVTNYAYNRSFPESHTSAQKGGSMFFGDSTAPVSKGLVPIGQHFAISSSHRTITNGVNAADICHRSPGSQLNTYNSTNVNIRNNGNNNNSHKNYKSHTNNSKNNSRDNKMPDLEEVTNKAKDSGNIILPPCRICGAKASGFHYGVNSCEACKGFFRRALKRPMIFQCTKNKTCNVKGNKRSTCRFCRYKRCLSLGMSREAIKTGRYSHKKRTRDTIEVKRLQSAPHAVTEDEDLDTILHTLMTAHDSLIPSFGRIPRDLLYQKQLEYHNMYLLRKKFGDYPGLHVVEHASLSADLQAKDGDSDPTTLTKPASPSSSTMSSSSSQISNDSGFLDEHDHANEDRNAGISQRHQLADKQEDLSKGVLEFDDSKKDIDQGGSPHEKTLGKWDALEANDHHDKRVNLTQCSSSLSKDKCMPPLLEITQENMDFQNMNVVDKVVREYPILGHFQERLFSAEDDEILKSSSGDTPRGNNHPTHITHLYSKSTHDNDEHVTGNKFSEFPKTAHSPHSSFPDDDLLLKPKSCGFVKDLTLRGDDPLDFSSIKISESSHDHSTDNSKSKDSVSENTATTVNSDPSSMNGRDSSEHINQHHPSKPVDEQIMSSESPNQDTKGILIHEDNPPLQQSKDEIIPSVKPETDHQRPVSRNALSNVLDMRSETYAVSIQRAQRWIAGYVGFAKAIPGFSTLLVQDQAALLRHAWDEVWTLGAYRGYNKELSVAVMPCGKCFHSEEMEKGWGSAYARIAFELAEIIKGHNLTPELITLLKAVCIVSPDRCSLLHRDKVGDIHWRLVTCLLHHLELTRPGDHMTFPRLVSVLTSLRELSESAQRNLESGGDEAGPGCNFLSEAFTPF